MWLLNGAQFIRLDRFQSMAFQLPELGMLSLAMMITMLTGGINLSIIASANLSGIIAAMILTKAIAPDATGLGPALILIGAVAAALATAAMIGLLNGFLIACIEVSPILATLGMMILVKGLSTVLTGGYSLAGLPQALLFVGNGSVLGIPVPMIVFAACAAVMALILNRTPTGVSISMLGSNARATCFAGVPNARVLLRTCLISGLYAGIAALIMIARFNSAKADYGESYLLMTVLASVLGGVAACGGFGRVSGLVISLIVLQVVSSGLNLSGASAFLTMALWGVVLIAVMAINFLMEKHQEKRRAHT